MHAELQRHDAIFDIEQVTKVQVDLYCYINFMCICTRLFAGFACVNTI